MLGLAAQSRAWTVGFVALAAFVAACSIAAVRFGATAAGRAAARASNPAPALRAKLGWVGFAFVPSALLVAVTAHISADIAAAPFLWVLPLALFLLTFVIVFQRKPILPHRWMLKVQPIVIAVLVATIYGGLLFHAAILVGLHLLAFFVSAMVAHGELVRRRPPAQQLTAFYLCMSLGGVLGGVFAALLAPLLFNTVAEYPILIVAALLTPAGAFAQKPAVALREIVLGAAVAAVLIALRYSMELRDLQLAVTLTAGMTMLIFSGYVWRANNLRLATLIGLIFIADAWLAPGNRAAESVRSFFGVNRVADVDDGRFRLLFNGTTLHGAMRVRDEAGQPVSRPEPTTYYHPQGPFGDVIRMTQSERAAARVAAVGLGNRLARLVHPPE